MPNRETVDAIRQASRQIVRELGLLSDQSIYDLPLSFRHVLIALGQQGPMTQMELAEQLLLDKSTISSIVKKLSQENLITQTPSSEDQRYRHIALTSSGKKQLSHINQTASKQVDLALSHLSCEKQNMVVSGLRLYAKALARARQQQDYDIRVIKKSDNIAIELLIREVLIEYGANRPGFAYVDPELGSMYENYRPPMSRYLVIERQSDSKIVGGAGIGPLKGSNDDVCELKRMYFSKGCRGIGLGTVLLEKLLQDATKLGYKKCYLETLDSMIAANGLYNKMGFWALKKPLGKTGHFGCDAWLLKELTSKGTREIRPSIHAKPS